MRFEVLVPAAPPARPLDVALRLDADDWLGALREALAQAGGAAPPAQVLCDVQADGSIHVADPLGEGAYRIRELRPGAAAAPTPAAAGAPAAARGAPARAGTPAAPPIPEDVLAELFERVSEIDRHRDRKGGLTFLLDLAMESIGCAAGAVLTAQLAGRELVFAAARGPRADRILRLGLTVPVGAGIVGFCVRENVTVAVSDAQRDPRFHGAISQAVGYETRSILCAPMAREGRVFGALEVLNKARDARFDATDVAVLSYLAHRAAEFLGMLES